MVFKSFDILRCAGFDNVNLDLMFAIPGQTLDQWSDTLVEAAAMGPEHLSAYEVIYEEDTPLYAQLQAGECDINEDVACAMFDQLIEHAAQAGFERYEVANFARGGAGDESLPLRACRHNVNYWRGGSFYGLGPSATSYVHGKRSKNWSNTIMYCQRVERGESPTENCEELLPEARAGETAAFGLRMVAGWSLNQFREVTGLDLQRGWGREMEQLAAQGWAQIQSNRFRLTHEGLRFADAAAEMFLR
jgi:oxygen-independent coproporphyrinogen-3 oxidase